MNKIVIIVILIIAVISMNIQAANSTWVVNRVFKESDFNKHAYNIYLDEDENIWVVYPSNTKDIAKKTVLMGKYDKKKKLLLQFDTKVPYPSYFNYKFDEKKIALINPGGRYYPLLNFKKNKLYLFNPFTKNIIVYNFKNKLLDTYTVNLFIDEYERFSSSSLVNFIDRMKEYENYDKQHMNWLYGKLLVDNNNNIYIFESNYISVDEEFDKKYPDVDIEHNSGFIRFSEDGSQNIPDGIIINETGGSNLCIYYNPYTNLIYYFGGFDWNLKIYDINFNKITEVDVFEKKKWNNFNDIINYYLTKESSHGSSYIVTIYSDKEGNVYIANLNNITILNNKYEPKDVISGYNLKKLEDHMIIDEVVKAEGNTMWLKVRRCISGKPMTSTAIYEMELWEIEKK